MKHENQFAPTTQARVWIVVISKPGQEIRAKRELMHQGFEVYLPMKLTCGRDGVPRGSPFLPRYMFVRVGVTMREWRPIWSTLGVSGILGAMDKPTGVADFVVERIMAQEDGGYIRMGLDPDVPEPKAGERVYDTTHGIEGLFEKRIDGQRATYLVSFLGRESRFTVDIAKLRVTGGQQTTS